MKVKCVAINQTEVGAFISFNSVMPQPGVPGSQNPSSDPPISFILKADPTTYILGNNYEISLMNVGRDDEVGLV